MFFFFFFFFFCWIVLWTIMAKETSLTNSEQNYLFQQKHTYYFQLNDPTVQKTTLQHNHPLPLLAQPPFTTISTTTFQHNHPLPLLTNHLKTPFTTFKNHPITFNKNPLPVPLLENHLLYHCQKKHPLPFHPLPHLAKPPSFQKPTFIIFIKTTLFFQQTSRLKKPCTIFSKNYTLYHLAKSPFSKTL